MSDLQQQLWQELISHREPPPPLEFTRTETKSFEQLTDYSPVFKALVSKHDLEITEEQQEILRSLAVSVSTGISWIESGPGDRAPFLDGDPRNGDTPRKKTLAEFIWHTERFILFGVLTRTQAETIAPGIHDVIFDSN